MNPKTTVSSLILKHQFSISDRVKSLIKTESRNDEQHPGTRSLSRRDSEEKLTLYFYDSNRSLSLKDEKD